MINFNFYIESIDDNLSGLEMGGMEIEIDGKKISSKNGQPSQSMMIFIALSDLLEGLVNLSKKNNKKFEFIGTDSSFKIFFEKKKKGILKIIYEEERIEVNFKDFIQNCYQAVSLFYEKKLNKIDKDDAAMYDLKNSLKKFHSNFYLNTC